jgi:hypothetical protein
LINLKGLGHDTDFKFFDKKQAKNNGTVQNKGLPLCTDESTTEHLHHPDNTEQRRKQITEQSMQPSTAVYAAEDRADALSRGCGQPVWRIRDVYPGSRILIFTHHGSRIQKQQQKREVKKNVLSYLFM